MFPGGWSSDRLPRVLLGAALAVALCLSCAGKAVAPGLLPSAVSASGERVIPGVPFHAQAVGQCGPASLAGVLNHHGCQVRPEEIAADVLRPDLRATSTLDLALWPRGRGFTTRWYRGSAQDIADKVGQGLPLVVMLDQGMGPVSANHFVVVVGHAPDAVIVNDGDRGPGVRMDWPGFLRQWERAGFWTLLVEPVEPVRAVGTKNGEGGP